MKKVEMDRVTLYQGDCMNTMAQIADGSVDGLIIDPPYSSGGTFSTQRKAESGKKYLDTGGAKQTELPSFSGDNMDMRSFTMFMRAIRTMSALSTPAATRAPAARTIPGPWPPALTSNQKIRNYPAAKAAGRRQPWT